MVGEGVEVPFAQGVWGEGAEGCVYGSGGGGVLRWVVVVVGSIDFVILP